MRYFLGLFCAICLALSACNSTSSDTLNAKEQQIVGTWETNSPIVIYQDNDATVTLTSSRYTYRADKTASSTMEMETASAALEDGPIKMKFSDTMTWSVSGQSLNETLTSSSIEVLNYKDLMAGEAESMEQDFMEDPDSVSQIKSLSDTEMTLFEPADDITIKLKKVSP